MLVVGDVMLDRYWSGKAARISPEAPVPVVHVKNIEDRVGGAGNVALNIAKLGAKVTLLGVIGDDEEGRIIQHLLEAQGVDCKFVVEKSAQTIRKLRVIAQHQQLVRIDFEETPVKFEEQVFIKQYRALLAGKDSLIFSDYGKGTLVNIAGYIQEAKRAGIKILVDPKGVDYARYAHADILTPNFAEFQAVAGRCATEQEIVEKGRGLLEQLQVPNLLLTRGESGMTLIQDNFTRSLPAQAKDVFDVTGAGDTVIAVMALGAALNLPLTEAMYLANLAGGIVVGKLGTSTVSPLELTQAMHSGRDSAYGIVTEDQLAFLIAGAKAHNEKIIMTNGCFDLLHAGHVAYLQQARALGDRLIVAVNSNDSVKKLKGDGRPINGLEARMAVLSALACVDWVVPFEEETPERLYCKLLPDVLVKGGDYAAGQVAGSDCVIKAGGEVKILQFVEGHSTTSMINKARAVE